MNSGKYPNVEPDKSEQAGKSFKRAGVITGIVFTILLMVILNFFNEYIGVYSSAGGTFYPLLNNTAFNSYLLYINVVMAAQLIFQMGKLVYRKWTFGLAIGNLVLNGASLILFFNIMGDPALLNGAFLTEMSRILADAKGGLDIALKMLKYILYFLVSAALLYDTAEGFYYAYKNRKR